MKTKVNKKKEKPQSFYEVSCCQGLERFIQRELRRIYGDKHKLSSIRAPGAVLFSLNADWKSLVHLKTAHDVFRVIPFNAPRPRSILEPSTFQTLSEILRQIIQFQKKDSDGTFRFSAAGADSKDLLRIREAIKTATGLKEDPENGKLLIRLRRSQIVKDGWEILVRVSASPLMVRAWRRKDYRGALDATIARVMVELADAKENEIVLDPMCGSGTLLAEQIGYRKTKQLIGVDSNKKVLEAAEENVISIRSGKSCSLVLGDACSLENSEKSVDVILINPPWGEAIGAKTKLLDLYRDFLKEAHRVLKKSGRLCIIVENQKLLEEALADFPYQFKLIESHRALQRKGFHPTISLLQKN